MSVSARSPLLGKERVALEQPTVVPANAAWKMLSWFGLVLAGIGMMDFLLVFYPFRMGDPTWEFGAVDTAFSSLPLLTMGIGLSLTAALAMESRWRTRTWAVIAALLALLFSVAFVVYLTNVPIALKLAPQEVAAGIRKSVVRTSIMGITFTVGYMAAAVIAFRRTATRKR